jgi:hypothetical protein
VYRSPYLNSFIGFLSDSYFDRVEITAAGGFDAVIDNLYFGVPAPGALWVFGAAWLLHGRRRRPAPAQARRAQGAPHRNG